MQIGMQAQAARQTHSCSLTVQTGMQAQTVRKTHQCSFLWD